MFCRTNTGISLLGNYKSKFVEKHFASGKFNNCLVNLIKFDYQIQRINIVFRISAGLN